MASPTKLSPQVAVAPAYARSERRTRRPQCPFNVIVKPFQIQPVCFHPVLPGETLKTLMLQSQVWSDPLASTLKSIGWWCEYNVFYVKHRDLMGYEQATDGLGRDLIDMFVSNESIAAHQDADGNIKTYCPPKGVDFCLSALQRVVDEYFRDEGESYAVAEVDGIPVCAIYGRGRSDAFDKLTLAANYADHRQKLDADNDGVIYVGDEMNRAFNEWAAAHDAGLIDMTYEDWMKTYGGSAPNTDLDRVDYHRPEDLSYVREFTYPNNTVEPSTGIPAVAAGWRVSQQLRKSFRFEEPGWILVTQTIRPKVYLKNQQGLVAAMMQTRDSWLPAVLNDETTVGHLQIAADAGPLEATMAAPYMVSIRDLLLYGEQFCNHTSADGNAAYVTLPEADGDRRYPTAADVQSVFLDTVNGRFRADGMISLGILGRQSEVTRNLTLYRA